MAVDVVQDLAQNAEAADAGDQQVSRRSGVDADGWAGADPSASALGADDLVIGNLDAKLVPTFAAVEPKTLRVKLQSTVEGISAVSPGDRVTRHPTDLRAPRETRVAASPYEVQVPLKFLHQSPK
jgi:hypothetical protein